jgi:hypothetical protein
MTSYLPVALTSPAEWFVASTRITGPLADARPGWAGPGKDRSGLWLRNATAGLCVLAAAAATVSFTAFGALRYQNCLNAFRAGAGRGLAVSGLAGCGG